MSLAPLAGVSLLLGMFYLKYENSSRKFRWFYILLIVSSFLVLILAASRIAIVGAFVSSLYLLTRFYRDKYSSFVKVIFILSIIIAISYPLWEGYTEDLVEKTEQRDEEGNQLSSREDLWAFRLEEFNQSPVIGIGFANSMYGSINYDTGTVEPGTSWGAVLAMTGVLGFLVFVILIIKAFRSNAKKNLKTNLSSGHILNAILIFFMCHWIAEGYILAAGSFLFFYSWLILGVSSVNQFNHEIKVL
jgi:O-antigen ligase